MLICHAPLKVLPFLSALRKGLSLIRKLPSQVTDRTGPPPSCKITCLCLLFFDSTFPHGARKCSAKIDTFHPLPPFKPPQGKSKGLVLPHSRHMVRPKKGWILPAVTSWQQALCVCVLPACFLFWHLITNVSISGVISCELPFVNGGSLCCCCRPFKPSQRWHMGCKVSARIR